LFGQLPADVDRFSVDLLGDPPDGDAAIQVAQRLAIQRFAKQMLKAGLVQSVVREAVLELTRGSKPELGHQGHFEAQGRNVGFLVRVVMDGGWVFERRHAVFVAAHDPSKEKRRNTVDWGT
jgi:hypothetical protein